MVLITDTYSEEAIVKTFLVASLYTAATLTADIAAQAANAKTDINNFIGRATDFTVAELEEVKNKPVVLSASQFTAYLMQKRAQERAGKLTEDTVLDGGEAKARIELWMVNNGLTPPSERKVKKVNSEVNIQYSDSDYVIYGEAQ